MAKAGPDCMFNTITGKSGDSVYCRRHGRIYVRRYVKPRNPGTESQVKNRGAFSRAVRQWRELPVEARNWYNYRAANLPMNGMNLFISETLMGTRRFDEPVNSGKNYRSGCSQLRTRFVHGSYFTREGHSCRSKEQQHLIPLKK